MAILLSFASRLAPIHVSQKYFSGSRHTSANRIDADEAAIRRLVVEACQSAAIADWDEWTAWRRSEARMQLPGALGFLFFSPLVALVAHVPTLAALPPRTN